MTPTLRRRSPTPARHHRVPPTAVQYRCIPTRRSGECARLRSNATIHPRTAQLSSNTARTQPHRRGWWVVIAHVRNLFREYWYLKALKRSLGGCVGVRSSQLRHPVPGHRSCFGERSASAPSMHARVSPIAATGCYGHRVKYAAPHSDAPGPTDQEPWSTNEVSTEQQRCVRPPSLVFVSSISPSASLLRLLTIRWWSLTRQIDSFAARLGLL